MTVALIALALGLSGVSTGVLLGSLVGPIPLLLALPADGYVRAKQFLTPRYDPAMPIMIVGNGVVDVVAVVLVHGLAARAAFAVAALLLAVMVFVSVTRNVPVNNWELTLDPDNLPADWAERDPRPVWHRWHLIRTGLLSAALVATVAGAVLYAHPHA